MLTMNQWLNVFELKITVNTVPELTKSIHLKLEVTSSLEKLLKTHPCTCWKRTAPVFFILWNADFHWQQKLQNTEHHLFGDQVTNNNFFYYYYLIIIIPHTWIGFESIASPWGQGRNGLLSKRSWGREE